MKKSNATKTELDAIYKRIPSDKKSEATLIYNELSFILETVETLKAEIREKGATEHFINGKQDFLRESPSLASYNKLMKTYDTFYKNLINLLDDSKEQENNNDIMDYSDFDFSMFCNDDYDTYEIIVNNKEYQEAKNDTEKQKIYDKLLKEQYEEYKKDPSNYLFIHDTLKD